MRRIFLSTAVSAAALLMAVSAQAQEPLRFGDTVQGKLAAGADDADDGPHQDYVVSARQGQRLEVVLRSEDFDAYLSIHAADETGAEALAEDDDGLGQGTDSRLRFTAPQDGDYRVRVRAWSGQGEGAYSLSLAELAPAPPAPTPRTVRIGDEIEGRLDADDPETDAGPRFDAYVLRLAAGDRVSLGLEADDFDPLVRIGRMEGGVFSELAYNDDAPDGGLNARLLFTAPGAGDYVIRASSYAAGAEGDYRLKLEQAPPAPAATPIALGQRIEGRLARTDGVNAQGRRVDLYRFEGQPGQRITITATSSDFDAYLELFRDTAGGPVSVAQDDDSGGGTNARINTVLEEGGVYLIEARAFSDGLGAYGLKLEETLPPPAPTPLAFGATVQGEITTDNPAGADGRPYKAYVFSGQARQRVRIIVRSGDFDSLVSIGRPGDDWSALATDDDGLGEGLDARLNYTLPEDGDYEVRVMPWAAEKLGLYSVEMTDRGPEPRPGSLVVGATVRGTLSDEDGVTDEGAAYDAYEIQAKAGEKLRLTLVSNAFDSVVEVGRTDEDGAFDSLESDDDGLSDTHARLDWTAPEDGLYVIRARSYAPNSTGDYALTVEKQP
ncbi:MAG: PPC domain-containing protein [Brevundimonas sp.]|uniref:PPC domain-containing protein n=1 Tax=Brevundimonas sp. TaxID=1871086 RepID=UPI0025C10DEE|nr:PPC domain-containing protein [Brevundimonas sp.]MBX3476120.1 PPC domain-containing protein [Brevundimonas sp.]